MLTAVLTDIHANREAFEACLDDAARRRPDAYVFLGDYVGYGPDPGWCVDTIADHVARGAVALQGNHDEAALVPDERMNPLARAAIAWTRQRLDGEQRAFLADRPLSKRRDEVLFVHANAWAPADWGYVTDCREAERSLCRTDARVTLCGHVHVPALYQMAPGKPPLAFRPVPGCDIPLLRQRRWLGVIPAVGQPRDGNPAAGYALLRADEPSLTYVRVPYDAETTARKILAAGLPPMLAARLLQGR